ncbi:hypothetical protein NKH77_19380 [Streptomyces sp. M19]
MDQSGTVFESELPDLTEVSLKDLRERRALGWDEVEEHLLRGMCDPAALAGTTANPATRPCEAGRPRQRGRIRAAGPVDPDARPRHGLPPRHFDALASGGGGASVIAHLWDAERSRRLVLLGLLLAGTVDRPDATGPLLPLERPGNSSSPRSGTAGP